MIVVKFGGNALAQASENRWLDLIADYHKGGGRVVIIHGGGPQIDAELSLHGVPRNFVEGYRFTDGKTMQIVEMVLASIGQYLVRELRARGVRAHSLTGSDGGLFEVDLKKSPSGPDLGQVGEVRAVKTEILELITSQGFLPVVSSCSSLPNGLGINVNADLAAGALAGAISAEKIIFMTDVKGIYRHFPDEESLIAQSSPQELAQLLPSLHEGMIPKVEAVIQALNLGAKSAQIIDGRSSDALALALQGKPEGTLVHHG